MMMKLGYNKKNSDEILNIIRNSSNVISLGDIFNKTTSMVTDLGTQLTSKFNDMMNNTNTNLDNTNTSTNGKISYVNVGGYKRRIKKHKKPHNKTKNKKYIYYI
jgi:hypothetical protein